MAKEPNAMRERNLYMPEWMLKQYLDLRHAIEKKRGHEIKSGDEFRIVARAGLHHVNSCDACQLGENCPDAVGRADLTPFSPEPKQAEIKAPRARKGKASG